ncbi:PIR protein [Plasmodium vivax]|uniref:VIR protein n=1 Tax=Plasmodium vivax TaxID=5855 RepID=A0A565A444_PLAVI|nr:PIR protein [Plasmodium vivax]VUZ99534.1 PIR protein [Plasmodium vivax]
MTGQEIFTKIITHTLELSDELNSGNFYEYLNGLNILDECREYCEPLLTLDRGGNIKNICARTLSYLKTKYSTLDYQNDEYDVCTLLNYWVYNRLFMAYSYKNFSKVIKAFGELQPIWDLFIDEKLYKNKSKICKPIFNIVIQDDWQERKELLNYCVDVNALIRTTFTHPQSCNKYYQYIERKTELYKQYEQACKSGNKNMCPEFFKACEVYDPEKVLPKLQCHSEMEKRKPAASAISMREDEKNLLSPVNEAVSADDSQIQHGNTPAVTKAGNILLGVVITSMTSGALYRFTPLGGMIRNGLGRNNNNMRNMHGGEYGLFDYATESFNPYTGGGEEHYIGYHPA